MNEVDLLETKLGNENDFYEAQVDDDGHVIGLSLHDMEYGDFQFEGDLLAELSVFSSLKDLEIEFNHFKIKDLSGLVGFPELERLVLIDCCDTGDISVLKYLKKLTILSISSAKITNIDSLAELIALKNVILLWNEIENIDGLKNHPNLEYVNLFHNNLTDISALATSQNLQNLAVGDNKLRDISFLRHLKKIEYLEFRNNAIESVDFLESLTLLKTLTFSGNPVKSISALKSLKCLTGLEMRDVPVKNLSSLDGAMNLEYLYAGPIENFDGAIVGRFTQLISLQLKDCAIGDLSFLQSLKKLHTLNLDNNGIRDVKALYDLKQLKQISLKNNAIDEPFEQLLFDNLAGLNLEGNQFGNKVYKYDSSWTGMPMLDADVADYWLEQGDDDKALAHYYIDVNGKIPLLIYYRKLLATGLPENYLRLYYIMRCEMLISQLKENDQETLNIKSNLISIIESSDFSNKEHLLNGLQGGRSSLNQNDRYYAYGLYLRSGLSVKQHPEMLYKLANDTLKSHENLSEILSIYQQLIELESPLQIALYRTIRRILVKNFSYTEEKRKMQAMYMDMLNHARDRKMPVYDTAVWFENYYKNNIPKKVTSTPFEKAPPRSYERNYPDGSSVRLIARILLAIIALIPLLKACH